MVKLICIIFSTFIFFVQCSFLNSKSFYETFVNPEISEIIKQIDQDSLEPAPDLETVPKN